MNSPSLKVKISNYTPGQVLRDPDGGPHNFLTVGTKRRNV